MPSETNNYQPVHTVDEVNAIMRQGFADYDNDVPIDLIDIRPGGVTLRMDAGRNMLRPGGTVSGPALFFLADFVGWACALSHVRADPLMVTTNLTMNFLRKAGPGTIDGVGRILKIGKSLISFDCDLVADGKLVAQASGTYFIPPLPE